MACFICLGVVNSCCGELKYANFSEINSNYSLPPVSFPPFTARVCVIWNLTIAYGPLITGPVRQNRNASYPVYVVYKIYAYT